jgi:hypothetical protein
VTIGAAPRGVWLTAGILFVVVTVVAGRYGYHRDELYFIEGGHHLSWGQPDNPVLVPLLAAGWHDLVRGQLWAFRLLPAVAAALTVVVAAKTSAALGGARRHQTAAAAATALTSIVPATGHLFSITTFDILLTATTLLLVVRALRDPARLGPWLLAGLVAGVALEVKVLLLLVLFSCLAAMLLRGPRAPLRRPGPWLAALVAAVLAAPYLIWQGRRGWPMLQIADNIAAGGSASSVGRLAVIPLHLLLVGPVISVVLVAGLVVLSRSRELTPYRWLPVAYVLFAVVVVVTGGKPYYLAGFFPVILAAGAAPVLDWVLRRRSRRIGAVALLSFSCVVTGFLSLPLAPVGSPVFRIAVGVNPDAAETVGWPGYVATVRSVAAGLPAEERSSTVILARNYGEAGALARARRLSPEDAALLPPVFSGHNAFADWGPPPATATTALVVGRFPDHQLRSSFGSCRSVATLTSPPGVDNEEAGAPVRVCRGLLRPWVSLWPAVRRLA